MKIKAIITAALLTMTVLLGSPAHAMETPYVKYFPGSPQAFATFASDTGELHDEHFGLVLPGEVPPPTEYMGWIGWFADEDPDNPNARILRGFGENYVTFPGVPGTAVLGGAYCFGVYVPASSSGEIRFTAYDQNDRVMFATPSIEITDEGIYGWCSMELVAYVGIEDTVDGWSEFTGAYHVAQWRPLIGVNCAPLNSPAIIFLPKEGSRDVPRVVYPDPGSSCAYYQTLYDTRGSIVIQNNYELPPATATNE